MDAEHLDAIVAFVRERVGEDPAVDPVAVRFLLAQYAATGRDDLSAIVGEALARAMQTRGDARETRDATEWLLLFADAATWTDDDRVDATLRALLAPADLSSPDGVDAALRAAAVVDDRDRLASAVDELERLVGRGYEPGDGVAAADQFAVASALLTAYDITGRLPYPMLAEELVLVARQRGWDAIELAAACRASRVLSRLAALHRDDEYVRAAVVAPGADYGADAARLLERHAAQALDSVRGAAQYGLALALWLSLH